MGVFYSSPQDFVLDEIGRRQNEEYVKSRLLNGCYVTMAYRRTEAQYDESTSVDVGEAIVDGLSTVGRGAVDLMGGGLISADSLFGEGTLNPGTVESVVLLAAAWIVGDSLRVTE